MLQPVHTLFNHPGLRRALLGLRYPLSLALLAVVAHARHPSLLRYGLAVSLVGEAIQLWALGSLVKNRELTTRGPYLLVRNPMYLGRYLLILGFVLVTGRWWAIAAYSVVYWFYMVNRVGREERRLGPVLGEPYREYCSRVHRFLPNPGRLGDPGAYFFDVAILRGNNGHWNLLGTLLAWGALFLLPAF